MCRPKTSWLLLPLVSGLLSLAPAWHPAPTEVDLALVLAVDVSTSMDADEQALQRQGYVEAFRSALVHQAIRSGMRARIAVTYVEWAGAHPHHQHVVVPWSVLETPQDAAAFAGQLARAPIHSWGGTSIAEAIDFSMALLWSGDFLATRRVIDISGDGSNNQGRLITDARDEAIARGVIINGLPLMLKMPDRRENAAVDAYYRDCVIGGLGAFMIPVRERQQFLAEIRTKIIREIAGVSAPDAQVQAVQRSPRTDCDTSESLWDDVEPDPHTLLLGSGRALSLRDSSGERWLVEEGSALHSQRRDPSQSQSDAGSMTGQSLERISRCCSNSVMSRWVSSDVPLRREYGTCTCAWRANPVMRVSGVT